MIDQEKRTMNVRTSGLMKILTVAPICAAALGAFGIQPSEASAEARQQGSAAIAANVPSLGNEASRAVGDVVAAISPSVVSIRAVTWTDHFHMGVDLPDYRKYDSLRDFFGRAFMDQFFEQRAPTRGYEHRSVGTGVILSHDGHVLTNAHVIGSAEQITVVLHDGRALDGEVVGIDPQTDLALLKISASGLVAARPPPLNAIRIGQDVLAIGNPFGISPVVSRGVVGTPGRGKASIGAYEDFMQTDIPVHLANTGGPLINLAGEVVGITTDRPWHGAPSRGPGFAVPIHMAQVVTRNLIDHGKMRRPTLGVGVQNLTENLATSFGFQGTDGVLVSDVAPGGSGEKAGMRSGDIILRVHGSRTEGANAFNVAVSESPIGELVDVEFVRTGVCRRRPENAVNQPV